MSTELQINAIKTLMNTTNVVFNVAITYARQTRAHNRSPNSDYLLIPGAKTELHIGDLVAIKQNNDGEDYFVLVDYARANGIIPFGWTAIKPAGILSLQVRGLRFTAQRQYENTG